MKPKPWTGDRIRELRERIGEPQHIFAHRFHVNQSTVARWEIDGLPRRFWATLIVERLEAIERGAA